jgi:Phage Tail Collar Domain
MTKTGAALAALASMLAVPDFSAREWDAVIDGRTQRVQYCIKARPSPEAEVGTVLRFIGPCPYGWLHANGQYIVRELYPDLFAVLQSFATPEMGSGAR